MSRTTRSTTGPGFTERLARAAAMHPWRTIGVFTMALLLAGVAHRDAPEQRPDARGRLPRAQARQHGRLRAHPGPPRRRRQVTDFVIVRNETKTVDDSGLQGLRRTSSRRDRRARRRCRRVHCDHLPDRRPEPCLEGQARDADLDHDGRRHGRGDQERRGRPRRRDQGGARRLRRRADRQRQPERHGHETRRVRPAEGRDPRHAGRPGRAGDRLRRRAGGLHAARPERREHRPCDRAHRADRPALPGRPSSP